MTAPFSLSRGLWVFVSSVWMVCCGFFIICLVLWNVVFFSGLVHSGLAVHGGSLRRKGEVPVAFGWWALPLVATVIGDHARGSQGSQQTAAKSLRSAVPADSGRRKRREWYRPQEQVCTQRASQCCQDAVIKRFWFINAFKAGMDWLRNSEPIHNIELLFSCIMSTFCVRWKSEILMIHDSCVIKISESFSSKWDIYYESSHSFNLWCTWTLATDSFFTRPVHGLQKFTATVIFVCLLLLCFEQNICCNVDKPTINL